MTASTTIVVDDRQFQQAIAESKVDLSTLINDAAEDLADSAAEQGGRLSSRLGEPWNVEGLSPMERHVEAPEWWAHFVAGGTQPHAGKMAFEVDGQWVYTNFVKGTEATHFDEAAVRDTESHMDDILRRAMRWET